VEGSGEGAATRDEAIDPEAEGRAGELLRRFTADRNQKTSRAYAQDVAEFARFLGLAPAPALARLLAAGPGPGRELVLEYARALWGWGRAPNTIARRLTTLRSLVRAAHSLGVVDWRLEIPGGEELLAMMRGGPPTESRHYLLPRHPSEIDRLDLQHYAIRLALGANHQAPVEAPARILDVGAGSGQWGFDMTEEFPEALVGVWTWCRASPTGPLATSRSGPTCFAVCPSWRAASTSSISGCSSSPSPPPPGRRWSRTWSG
jgi:hypothetical protein